MLIYAVRHGQSETNAAKIHGGWAQVPLTELGRKQAQYTGKLLEGIEFDAFYCSDLLRAKETAAIALPGREFTYTDAIREISTGDLTGVPYAYCYENLGEAYRLCRKNTDYSPFNGEKREDLNRRVAGFLQKLADEKPGENVVVVCHEGTIISMARFVVGYDFANWCLKMSNCGVTVLEYAEGVWSLKKWNETGSLAETPYEE